MKRLTCIALGWLVLIAPAHADYKLGVKYHVENDAMEFDAAQLFMDGRFAGWIYANSLPVSFSNRFYAYATCGTSKSTKKPDGYCVDWHIYDRDKKTTTSLALPGLTFSSVPSFSWPYIAYTMVPRTISESDFKRGLTEVSCAVIEWPSKRIVAQQKVMVNVGHFETDAPGSFLPPRFIQGKDAMKVACSEYSGRGDGDIIATVAIPR